MCASSADAYNVSSHKLLLLHFRFAFNQLFYWLGGVPKMD